jgi:MoaA/NifB/PqqE/SkfB family radical SAM enzyme
MKTYQNVACVAPWSSLHITDKMHPCCVIEKSRGTTIYPNKNLNWNFNHTNYHLRQEFQAAGTDIQKYERCFQCSSKNDSQNLQHNIKASESIDYIKDPILTYLHIKFSNKCNLSCRMCDPVHSNMLFKELKSVYSKAVDFDSDGYYENLSRDSVLYKSILNDLHNIKHLWFSGGEPFLHDEVWEILELMYEKDLTKDLTLQVNTNGTIKLTQHRLDILNSCKKLEMHISMDGFEKYAEYIRTGVVWDRWIENIREYKNIKHRLEITITVTVFNVHIIDKMIELFEIKEDFGLILNMVFNPNELSVINMNQRAKDYVNEKYKDIDNNKIKELLYFINENENRIDSNLIVDFIDNKDNHVLENSFYKNYIPFRDIDPEWYDILKG